MKKISNDRVGKNIFSSKELAAPYWGVILRIPIALMRRLSLNSTASLKWLIAKHMGGVDLPDSSLDDLLEDRGDIIFTEEFEFQTQTLLLGISSLKKIKGLFEMFPGMSYPHRNVWTPPKED